MRAMTAILTSLWMFAASSVAQDDRIPDRPPEAPRQDLFISGIYPHLTTYGVYSQNGAHYLPAHNECGIGAIVPWAGRLWMVNYAPHRPRGSEHKLFSIDEDLNLTVHPESVGGTPAGRMIHRESNQLLIAHYLIDDRGNVRVIPIERMPMRVTAIARHLSDPANWVYYIDMEGAIWQANVRTLEVEKLFEKPVPGWHSKGGYTGQGRLVVSNNGELAVGGYEALLVGAAATGPEEAGVLAEWDGEQWRIVERRQFTDITGPQGIAGGGGADDPIWAVGWDRKSVRLKMLDEGQWHTFLLPKASFCNDARHGWYTEWPRIRAITDHRWMMDMHGMFFDFPRSFSAGNTAGIAPIGSHLRYIPDFCDWNGRLVIATDETSIQGNDLAGQPQSNLWFGSYEDLKTWGPANGYGGIWLEDEVQADQPSDPFLVAGFEQRVLHLALGRTKPKLLEPALRAADQQPFVALPQELAMMHRISIERGDWKRPAPGYSFTVNQPVTVYLAVDQRGKPDLGDDWAETDFELEWGKQFKDSVYVREFPAGRIVIPGNETEHTTGSFGMPHTAFVTSVTEEFEIAASDSVSIVAPINASELNLHIADDPVKMTLQIDVDGSGTWVDHNVIEVPPRGYVPYVIPEDFKAEWLRIKTDHHCIATAIFHQTVSSHYDDIQESGESLFAGLANAGDESVFEASVYAAKRNRDLRVIGMGNQFFEFSKAEFKFRIDKAEQELADLIATEAEFSIDEASVVLNHRGRRLRLPKGSAVFDKPFSSGWPRGSREVESERHLANIHGTFYEVPLITNGQPPAYELMRPVSSHGKHITDYCSWNGLLVLAGVSKDAVADEHVFVSDDRQMALWFGGVDDLWKLGKPVGTGGPWKDTTVVANECSDPYLMTGYDKKTLSLVADADTVVTVEVDFDHHSGWHDFKEIELCAGEAVEYEFPTGFSAHWVRFRSEKPCQITAQLTYR